jgi:putative endonuclease
MSIETRRKANRLGHAAEWRAVWRLRLAGYSILARRYKTKLGEIDIVASFSLRGRQFGRVAAAASLFVARHPHYAAHSLRYDAMLVVGLWPRHLPDVWRAPE